jgi:hypothetical protein
VVRCSEKEISTYQQMTRADLDVVISQYNDNANDFPGGVFSSAARYQEAYSTSSPYASSAMQGNLSKNRCASRPGSSAGRVNSYNTP